MCTGNGELVKDLKGRMVEGSAVHRKSLAAAVPSGHGQHWFVNTWGGEGLDGSCVEFRFFLRPHIKMSCCIHPETICMHYFRPHGRRLWLSCHLNIHFSTCMKQNIKFLRAVLNSELETDFVWSQAAEEKPQAWWQVIDPRRNCFL